MAAPTTKSCPGCAKKLRADAPNCWFCGRMFDILRCIECGSPNRTGSPACQICGEPLPAVPLLVAKSDNPPVAQRADEQDCPDCRGVVPLAAVRCKHCGAELNSPTRQQAAKWSGATVRRSRGGGIVAAAVFSFLWLMLLSVSLAIYFGMGGRGLRPEFVLPLGGGLLLCSTGTVIAYRDLHGVSDGRVSVNDGGTTLVGGWMNGFTVVLYWCVIGYCVISGL